MRKAAVLNFDIQTREVLKEWLYLAGVDVNVLEHAEVERLSEKIRMMPQADVRQNRKKLIKKS